MGGWRRFLPRALRPHQLEMIWPESRLGERVTFSMPPSVELRTYDAGDEAAMIRLMNRAGFKGWGRAELEVWLPRVVPGGYFVFVDPENGRLVGTTMAARHPSPSHPDGGELAWLAVDPDYRGAGIGWAGSAATTNLLLESGHRRIYLSTDDHRLAALSLYLKLGYEPFLFEAGMSERWQAVHRNLARERA